MLILLDPTDMCVFCLHIPLSYIHCYDWGRLLPRSCQGLSISSFSLFPSCSLEKSPSEVIQYDPFQFAGALRQNTTWYRRGELVNMWILFCINWRGRIWQNPVQRNIVLLFHFWNLVVWIFWSWYGNSWWRSYKFPQLVYIDLPSIWGFPKMRVPRNHSFSNRIFHDLRISVIPCNLTTSWGWSNPDAHADSAIFWLGQHVGATTWCMWPYWWISIGQAVQRRAGDSHEGWHGRNARGTMTHMTMWCNVSVAHIVTAPLKDIETKT